MSSWACEKMPRGTFVMLLCSILRDYVCGVRGGGGERGRRAKRDDILENLMSYVKSSSTLIVTVSHFFEKTMNYEQPTGSECAMRIH